MPDAIDAQVADVLRGLPDWITPREVAQRLRLHPRTLQRMCARGAFPAMVEVSLARRVFIRAAVESWLRDRLRRRAA